MKKLLFLIILPFILGGCYDYNELNDLAIIAGVGIDYEDDNYIVTFEILSTKKASEQSAASSSYSVYAKGKTVTEAFMNNGDNMDKVPYYDHVEIVAISEEIAKNHLEDVVEYLIRSSKFRNEVYLVIAKDVSAQDLLKTTSKEKPVASLFMVDLLEHNNNSSSAAYYIHFTKLLNNMLTDGEDALISTVKVKDKEIILDGMATFKDFKLAYIFDNQEASVMNLLNNFNANTVLFTKSCQDNKKTVLSIYDAKINIEPNNDKVIIKGELNARINEDSCGYNFRDQATYLKLEKEFKKVISEEMDKIINKLKMVQSNSLNIGKKYYDKYRKDYYFLWTKQKFEYDLNLKINKKGLIFEVT